MRGAKGFGEIQTVIFLVRDSLILIRLVPVTCKNGSHFSVFSSAGLLSGASKSVKHLNCMQSTMRFGVNCLDPFDSRQKVVRAVCTKKSVRWPRWMENIARSRVSYQAPKLGLKQGYRVVYEVSRYLRCCLCQHLAWDCNVSFVMLHQQQQPPIWQAFHKRNMSFRSLIFAAFYRSHQVAVCILSKRRLGKMFERSPAAKPNWSVTYRIFYFKLHIRTGSGNFAGWVPAAPQELIVDNVTTTVASNNNWSSGGLQPQNMWNSFSFRIMS